MKRVTLALDDVTYLEACRVATERSTSLDAMIRELLEDLIRRESRGQARRRIAKLCRESRAEVGSSGWTRDDLHQR